MKNTIIVIVFTLLAQLSVAQTVDFDLISYQGLDFRATKSAIMKKLGKPQKIYDPNYECGFLSTASQDGIFLTLDYGNIKFTGNKKENYVLDYINFENDHSIVLKYGDYNLTHKTKLSELTAIFGNEIDDFGKQKDGDFIVFQSEHEDGLRIRIKNGKLVWIEYWSPC